jgi:hypothetical protein
MWRKYAAHAFMKSPEVDRLLRKMAQERLPELPVDFTHEVWRQIQHRKVTQVPTWKDRCETLFASLLQPTPVFASLALALAVGVTTAATTQSRTSPALGLQVFHPVAADLNIPAKP